MDAALMGLPERRIDGLIVERVGEETLVYDLVSHQAHRLNAAATMAWQAADGRTTTAAMAERSTAVDIPIDEAGIVQALAMLADAGLLTPDSRLPPRTITRRRLLGRTAIAVPVVSSILAPTASEAGSCRPSGASCTTGAQCCSLLCSSNLCI